MTVGRPLAKPKPPRVPLWVTEKELRMIALKFQDFRGGLSDSIDDAQREVRRAKTIHNRKLRQYRNARKEIP